MTGRSTDHFRVVLLSVGWVDIWLDRGFGEGGSLECSRAAIDGGEVHSGKGSGS